jgi:hypothetical protein
VRLSYVIWIVNQTSPIARNKNIDVLAGDGTQNHVHLVLRIPSTRPVSKSIRDLKANSSRYMSENTSCDAAADAALAHMVDATRRSRAGLTPSRPFGLVRSEMYTPATPRDRLLGRISMLPGAGIRRTAADAAFRRLSWPSR